MRIYIGTTFTAAMLFTILISGCTRSKGRLTTVNFRLPPKSSFLKDGTVSAQLVSQIADFDCLGVLVSAADSGLNQNSCNVADGSQFTAGAPNGPYVFLNAGTHDVYNPISTYEH